MTKQYEINIVKGKNFLKLPETLIEPMWNQNKGRKFMQTTFEQAVEVIRELSADDLERLEEWIEKRKSEKPAGENTERDMYKKRMNWLKANAAEYGGQYVVLDGDRLLGVAPSYPEGRSIAESCGVPGAFVNYLSRPDEEGFMGGW